ncbi:MAG: noncanonical pyrimidine nucleotidase, YjjG family [Cytophagales bacterium]|nr:MAG: noncanonical pyrimidine nucleotidase, YjjG family [Cytophagales bacterium]TAF61389.1 MAG: noncanonical pyrimidine nucleotidase, YjjG family [Cytophagales bacterium]
MTSLVADSKLLDKGTQSTNLHNSITNTSKMLILKPCKHIFWDLDHTLWDFEKNAALTLQELFVKYNLQTILKVSSEEFCKVFARSNQELWQLYNSSKINKHELRKMRFPRLFKRLGASESLVPANMEDDYQNTCRQQPHLMPHAREVLETLQDRKYTMHIISNGFQDAQAEKLRYANIEQFFDVLVTSESCSYRKPQRGIFLHTFQKCRTHAQEGIMIGDNLSTDIAGALAVQMRNVWYNPHAEKNTTDIKPTHQIGCLLELLSIL